MRYLLITTLSVFLLMGASIEDARKANEAYEQGNYEKAISLYKKAIDADPKNPKLYYNLASAQAKAGQSEQAIRTFEQFKSMTNDAERKAMSNYNIGNILAKAKKWDQAVDYYKKSLRYIANDEDAKHNYELAKKKQQEQKKQKKKNKKQQNKQNKKNKNKQNQQQQNKQDQQQKKQNQDQKKQQQNQNKQQKQRQNQQQQQQRKSKISKAEAEKILKALEQKEKNLLKEFKKQKVQSGKSKNEKDW